MLRDPPPGQSAIRAVELRDPLAKAATRSFGSAGLSGASRSFGSRGFGPAGLFGARRVVLPAPAARKTQ